MPRGRAARAAIQALALAGCGFLVVFMWKMQWFHDRAGLSYGLAMVSVVAAALILERVVAPTAVLTAVLENPALLWLGQISYSLYLIHVPVIVVVRRSIDGRASMAPAIALALVCGAALHYLVEAPFLRLKRGRTVAIVASDETTGR